MKVIIDIPKETYKGIMLGKWDDNGLAFYVKTGTPLDEESENHIMASTGMLCSVSIP